jgi:hypothetical protein
MNNKFNYKMYRIRLSNVLVILSVIGILFSCGSNKGGENGDSNFINDSTAVPEISFNNMVHDFGEITEGEKVAYVFTFTNTGTGSLVINNASASCGCTVPKYSRKPLAPGQKGTMEVVFSTAGFGGIQTKTITVQSNAKTPVVVLAVKADVKSRNR